MIGILPSFVLMRINSESVYNNGISLNLQNRYVYFVTFCRRRVGFAVLWFLMPCYLNRFLCVVNGQLITNRLTHSIYYIIVGDEG